MRFLAFSLLALALGPGLADAAEKKPIVAVFPIGGDATEANRDRAAFSLRAKLDRLSTFEVLDGAKMKELAAEHRQPIAFDTAIDVVKDLASTEKPDIIVWGELKGTTFRVNVLDARTAGAKPKQYFKQIAQPTDMRFAIEEILETVKGVEKFAHPIDESITRDAKSEELWKKNPNLVANGDFGDTGCWNGILASEYYRPPFLDAKMPEVDKVAIVTLKDGIDSKPNRVLAMNMSRGTAETYGLACLSDSIKIEPNTRYRLAYKYRSDGPTLHVFVKGYTKAPDINGKLVDREIYRRQVPPSGATHGKWVEIVDDLNPQHIRFPVTSLKVDLYVYLQPGLVYFDDVILKAVGAQTRKATDEAIDKPIDRPKGAKE